MGLLERMGFGTQEKPTVVPGVTTVADGNVYLVNSMEFSELNSYLPSNIFNWYTSGKKYIPYGPTNLFPLQLSDLYYSSPLHSTIIDMKTKMMAGDLDMSKIDSKSQIQIRNIFGQGSSLQYKLREFALDWNIFGSYSMEVIWNRNFTQIARVNRIPTMNVRLGQEDQNREIDKYYFSNDWRRINSGSTTNQIIEIPKFDLNDKVNQRQLLYVKNPSLDGRYYGVPGYSSGLNSIAADAAISVYQLSVVENGFNPGLAIKFYKKPNSPEQQREIINGLDRTYGGKKKAGKVMVIFSDGKELAPDITPIDVTNLDKQFTVLTESINDKVIFAHNAVSGVLYGRATQGRLGATNEYSNAFQILEKTIVAPDRKLLEETINGLLAVNNIPAISIDPFVIFMPSDQSSNTPSDATGLPATNAPASL